MEGLAGGSLMGFGLPTIPINRPRSSRLRSTAQRLPWWPKDGWWELDKPKSLGDDPQKENEFGSISTRNDTCARKTESTLKGTGHYLQKRSMTDINGPTIPRKEARTYIPHAFTADELHNFFDACDTIPFNSSKQDQSRRLTLPVFFRLLYSSAFELMRQDCSEKVTLTSLMEFWTLSILKATTSILLLCTIQCWNWCKNMTRQSASCTQTEYTFSPEETVNVIRGIGFQ